MPEKNIQTESNIKSKPVTMKNLIDTYKTFNGIPIEIDEKIPKDMILMTNSKKEIIKVINLANSNTEVIARGEYYYDPNRMGMHIIGDINLGDLLFRNKDEYNGQEIIISIIRIGNKRKINVNKK